MTAPATRRRVPGLRRLLILVLVLIVAGGLFAVAYFTPLMSARNVSVNGAAHVPTEDVEKVVAPLKGTPLLQISNGRTQQYAAAVVGVSPWIDTATITVSYPSTLVVEVTERDAVAYADRSGVTLIDAKGVPFIKVGEPPILTPKLTVENPGADDPDTKAAISVLQSLPQDIRGQVVEIGADSPANVRFVLRDKRVVYWGDASRADAKAAALKVVLTRPGREFTVIDPDVPTTR